MTGEMNIGRTTFSITPPQMHGRCRRRAPRRPCRRTARGEDEDGRPKYQVTRFQTIAPSSAAKRMPIPWLPCGVAISPSLTVLATPLPRKAPARFITAAIASAARGVSARVETEVAMAFAESWKPLV